MLFFSWAWTNLLSNTFFSERPLNLRLVNSCNSNQGISLNKSLTLDALALCGTRSNNPLAESEHLCQNSSHTKVYELEHMQEQCLCCHTFLSSKTHAVVKTHKVRVEGQVVSAIIPLTWMEFTQVKDLGSALLLKHSSKINTSYKLLEAIFNSHLLCTNDQFIINAERDLKQCLCH